MYNENDHSGVSEKDPRISKELDAIERLTVLDRSPSLAYLDLLATATSRYRVIGDNSKRRLSFRHNTNHHSECCDRIALAHDKTTYSRSDDR